MAIESRPLAARTLLHQEGVLGLVAVVGLAFRPAGPFGPLDVRGGWLSALAVGLGVGVAAAATMWLVRKVPAVRGLELWQRRLVTGWAQGDALAVALLSGISEEALLRALLQPVIGLVPAAALFALLHVLPDRRLWFWPLMAFMMGLVLGALFEIYGYPAAVTAHVALNAVALLRLRHGALADEASGPGPDA